MPKLITRRRVILAAGAAILSPAAVLASASARAQQAGKIPRVGVLHPGAPPPAPASYAVAALQKSLRDLGYIEGRTITLDYRYAGGKPEALSRLAQELVNLKVDVLVAIGTAPTNAAKAVTGTIPIVATDTQTDPVASGLIASLAKPGGNITGLFLEFGGLMGKMLELLTETVPGIRRAAVLWDAATGRFQSDALAASGAKLSIAFDTAELKQIAQLEDVLNAALKKRPQALIQLPSPVLQQASPLIAKFSLANRLPSISMFDRFPEAGGLMSYGPDMPAFFARIGPMVDKVLKGAKPGEIPIERPTTFELVLNLQAAKALGIKLPQAILVRATRVID